MTAPSEKPLTDDEARAIRERVEKATPGPWSSKGIHLTLLDARVRHPLSSEQAALDADFIANARVDVPRLLSSREADRKEIERLQAEIKDRIGLSNLWENLWHDAEKEIGELKEQLSTARLSERARCAQAIKDRVIDSAIRQASIRAIEASDD